MFSITVARLRKSGVEIMRLNTDNNTINQLFTGLYGRKTLLELLQQNKIGDTCSLSEI